MLDLKRVREDLQGTINRLETRGGDFSYLNKISELDYSKRKFVKQIEKASKIASFAVIIGENEIAENKVTLKNLSNFEQTTLDRNEFLNSL